MAIVVADGIDVQVEPSGEDCHWYVKPVADVEPLKFKVIFCELHNSVLDDVAVPAVGAPEHAEGTE